jgi:hypothetical protein
MRAVVNNKIGFSPRKLKDVILKSEIALQTKSQPEIDPEIGRILEIEQVFHQTVFQHQSR